MSKNEELEQVSDLKVIERYLRYALDFKEYATCTNGKDRFTFEALFLSRPEPFHLELEIREEDFATLGYEELASLDTPEQGLRISFSVNDVLFFAHARVLKRDQRIFTAEIDVPIFKFQRRDAVRIRILPEHKASLSFGGKPFPLYDLSAGGLALALNHEEAHRFSPGGIHKAARVQFAGKEYVADLQVMTVSPMKKGSDKLWKVGFKFRALPTGAEQAIAKEAYLYTQKIWSRWL